MPVIRTITLPTFLPAPGQELQKLLPLNHDSLSTMLGLCLAYLKAMHPAKLIQSDEPMRASAHITNLFLNDPLVQSLFPKGTSANTTTAKEFSSLQVQLASLENMLTNLAKATTEVRKDLKSKTTPPAKTAKPAQATAPNANAPAPAATYAAKAATPQRPSAVVEAAAYTWSENQRPRPEDICATINATLDRSKSTQVRISAARWTAKGNLVVWGGANTTAPQLIASLPHFSEALQTSFSALSDSSPPSPLTLCHNVKWSKLRLNAVPTGTSDTRGAFTPDEVHIALVTENPAYASLTITQKPSWVRDPQTYKSGTTSSLSVSFEDPDGTGAQNLLCHRTLYAFGHVITVKRWKQTPPKRAPSKPAPATATTPVTGNIPPSSLAPQPPVNTPITEHNRRLAEHIRRTTEARREAGQL